jgi:cytochrome c553
MKTFIILSLSFLFLLSCNNNSKKTLENDQAYQQIVQSDSRQDDAYKKMKTFCYSCHSPTAEMDMRMAPPMVAVKMHYNREYNNEEDFVNAIWEFTKEPDENKALMKGAISKFGLMPYVPYKEEDIKAIASYIYNNELEKPEWFDDHVKEKHGNKEHKKGKRQGHGKNNRKAKTEQHQQRKGPKEKGKEMAIATKQELGKNLMKAIAEKGTAGAVEFCNIQAIPITSAKEQEFNATIKRASDQPRNPDNKANERETEVISIFKEDIAKGETPDAIVDKNGNNFDFYYPITTNDMCLQCHGKVGDDISKQTYQSIQLKYPEDLAVGYGINEVRGVWHITFEKN